MFVEVSCQKCQNNIKKTKKINSKSKFLLIVKSIRFWYEN